eukprot:6491642-Amphidinium_carterae.9
MAGTLDTPSRSANKRHALEHHRCVQHAERAPATCTQRSKIWVAICIHGAPTGNKAKSSQPWLRRVSAHRGMGIGDTAKDNGLILMCLH